MAKGKSVSAAVEDRVEEIARRLTAGSELEVVDVEFVKEHEQYLRRASGPLRLYGCRCQQVLSGCC